MHTHIVRRAIKQFRYHLLRSPNGLVLINHLNAIFLTLQLEDKKLGRTIPYFKLLCHLYLSIMMHKDKFSFSFPNKTEN